ncbi:MAG: radical SAM protein [Acidobacteriota bacterium]
MRVMLVYHGGVTGRREYHAGLLPLGLGYLAATLRREGIETTLVNASRMRSSAIAALLAGEAPDVLGISVFTHNRHESARIAATYRRACPGGTVVIGGPHANHLPEQMLAACLEIDAVAIGEGEMTLLDLVRAKRDGTPLSRIAGLCVRDGREPRRTAPRPMVMDLDLLAPPDFGPPSFGVDARAQSMYLLSSRGCPADCSFCDSPAFWGQRLRFHSPGRVVADLRRLRDGLGLDYVSFRDDTFALHRGRAIELLTAIRDADLGLVWDCQTRVNGVDPERLRLMSQAGCHQVQYGVESGSKAVLAVLAKGVEIAHVRAACRMTRDAGLHLSIYLISGTPGEGEAEVRETEELVRAVLPHDGIVSPLCIYPGTPLYAQMRAAGTLGDQLFLRDRRAAILAREDPFAVATFFRYEKLLAAVARRARYVDADWASAERAQGPHAPLLLRRASDLLDSGDVPGATQALERARAAAPGHPWVSALAARIAKASRHGRRAARGRGHARRPERAPVACV